MVGKIIEFLGICYHKTVNHLNNFPALLASACFSCFLGVIL